MEAKEQATRELIHDLQKAVRGEVLFDDLTRHLYATDASDFSKMPLGVLLPRDTDDIQAAMEISANHGVPIIPRGGGSSLSGQTVGTGLIMDLSKHLKNILEINPEEKWVRVEPGVVLDPLNARLAQHGLMVGPDPSSSMVATMGGMAGNNSTGSHSFRYGMIADHIQEMEVVLIDGSKVTFTDKDSAAVEGLARRESMEGSLYREIPKLLGQYSRDIETRYPKTWRNVAGYRLDHLLKDQKNGSPMNLAQLIPASEGSLATITQIKLGVVAKPSALNLLILHYPKVKNALEMVPAILEYQPAAVELMTSPSIMLADNHPGFRPKLRKFVHGNPGALLIVEFAEHSQVELENRLDTFKTWLATHGYRESITHCTTPEQIANVWQIRKAVIGLLLSKPGDDKPIWIIDDATVPVDRLVEYTEDVVAVGKNFGIDINFDAHASAGCLHMGLELNLKTREGLQLLEQLSKKIMDVAIAHDGSTTGEHGEGLARSYFNEQLYGQRLHQAFREVKALFDPDNRLNPHKVINPIEPWDSGWLRYHPDYKTPHEPAQTTLDFSEHGGFAGLVEMCSGLGVCRSEVSGTMCPSFRVTGDELHSTRGRANILRAALSGKLGTEGLTSKEVYRAMELCLECKACRNECGSKVDMAKLKYEFLSQYQTKNGVPVRSRMFASMALADRVGSKVPRLANALYTNNIFRRILDKTVKIEKRRDFPLLALETFQQWFKRRSGVRKGERGEVILWDDCHISYHEPEMGVAAVTVLEAAGYEVMLIRDRKCCGRPMISKGLLKESRQNAEHNVARLAPFAKRGTPIIGVEPSCIACFRDEYPSLLNTSEAEMVAGQSFFFEEFIMELVAQDELSLPFVEPEKHKTVKLHTHCYQKAFGTGGKVVAMLRLLPKTSVMEIDSGCCGMAGSFGYQKEHYDISMAIGEQKLFPSIREAASETIIAAAGTSCRQQIKDGTERKALHPVIVLAKGLKNSPIK